MTTQEGWKKRIRERMLKTGERYGAARRALLTTTASGPHRSDSGGRPWAAEPQHPDAQVREKTGRGWNDWVVAIDAGPGRDVGHTAIADWVREQGVDAWWAQSVTVGYERITGLRLPGQMPDGTFSVSRSRVVALQPDEVRELIMDDRGRADLLPGFTLELLSKPTVKAPRFAFHAGDESIGRVAFAMDAASGDRTNLTVTHSLLPTPDEAEHWKAYWREWLDALKGASD